MALNIQFDKIAQSYNAERAHPPEVSAQIGVAIAQLAGAGTQVLELGVGTGRIALPVAAAGCPVVGIDIAHAMLRVAAQDKRTNSLNIVQGDIAQLPFADHAFGAVLAVHVLHLVTDWRGALAEVARVIQPGGIFIQGRDWRDPDSVAERLRAKLREAVMELVSGSRPPGAGAAIAQAITRLGGTPQAEVSAAAWITHNSPATILARMAERADAETWALDDQTLAAAIARVRSYAQKTYADVDAPLPVAQRFVLNPVRF